MELKFHRAWEQVILSKRPTQSPLLAGKTTNVMKLINLSLLCLCSVACLCTLQSAFAQTPHVLRLQVFAGVNVAGAPGDVYAVQSTTNPTQTNSWSTIAFIQIVGTNTLFVDTSTPVNGKRFYRGLLYQATNVVFIPPNTFTMGSSTNDLDHDVNENPQTKVVLTHSFCIGKYEVTQEEYLSIMNTNPSSFPGDLSRPISNVSWFDATNYCAKLTERELAAGRIPPGTRFRLPTEAEWECAARAGTSTRFSYGDDPAYASTANYAWELANASLSVHVIGQKLPNPWGIYDMYGNVWEWCQDWYGTFQGGVQVDPTGPTAPVQLEAKVIRGGAYDYPESSCRSATRLLSSPFHTDTDIGFRVVLSTDP